MADERKREQQSDISFEYYHLVAMRAADNLAPDFVDRESKKIQLGDFLDQIADDAERSGDPTFMNQVANFLERIPSAGNKIVGILNSGMPENEAMEWIEKYANHHEFLAERTARGHAQSVAEQAALEAGFSEHQAQLIGREAWTPAHQAESARIDHNPSENVDPAIIGMSVAAEAFMTAQGLDGSSAYDVYEALVITSEDPDGFVGESDVVRSLQALENGEEPEFDGELHELAARLRQALDAGIDPNLDILGALELPEAAVSPALSPEQVGNIRQRVADFRDDHDQSGNTSENTLAITPAP